MTYQLVAHVLSDDAENVLERGSYEQAVREFDLQIRVAKTSGYLVKTYPTEGTVRSADISDPDTLKCEVVLMVSRDPDETKCQFCGSTDRPLDCYGNCKPCNDGMARTNGD